MTRQMLCPALVKFGRCDMLGKKLETIFLVTGILLLASLASFCQPADEGYDPMLQITHQFAKPNLLLVLDITQSMTSSAVGAVSVGVDSVGAFPYWSKTKPVKGVSPCSSTYYKTVATLKKGTLASRMAIVKNALGNSVTLYDWDPTTVSSSQWQAITTNSGWYWAGVNTSSEPTWYYCRSSSTTPNTDPFTVTSSVPGLTSYPPKDLIGQTKDSVNWAVVTFPPTSGGDCYYGTVRTQFDLAELGDVTDIENLLRLNTNGGLGTISGTSTRGAAYFARQYLLAQAQGTSLVSKLEGKSTTYTFDRDDKFFSCARTYGVVLVTDGESNKCNCSDSTSSSSSWSYCTTASKRAFESYPAGRINELYNTTISYNGKTYRMEPKTWVIGVSDEINPCEINFCAYMGRTDASSPLGDAGFKTSGDLARQPNMNTYTETASDPFPNKVHYTTLVSSATENSTTSHFDTNSNSSSNYGFFANDADALADAFADIVAGLGTGDYTTSSPVANPGTSSSGSQVYLTTAQFPEWNGHLYCYNSDTDPADLLWDAGEVLTAQSSSLRKIYTWDSSNSLVQINSTNLNTLKSIASAYTSSFDSSTFTSAVVDFIIGNTGGGAARSWKLGGIVNSTPTLVMPPESYTQGTVDQSHADFVSSYGSRETLLYSGSDDGMLHAFLTEEAKIGGVTYPEGSELFAVLPPNLLALQVSLYDNYVAGITVTGQEKKPKEHIYGVANSPRYGDVYFPSEAKWRTMLYLTEGPGGEMVAAIDISDPFGKLTQDPPVDPVSVIWHHTAASCPELKKSWCVPAFGSSSSTAFKGLFGTGYDSVNTTTSPYVFTFNPVDGSLESRAISAASSPTPYLRNQAFADSVIYQTNKNAYYADNIVDLGVQADLHGRLWFYDRNAGTFTIGVNASAIAGTSQPIYYPPAVSGYKKGTNTYDIYTFASGTYYEKDTDITGTNVGKNNYFQPSMWIAVQNPWSTSAVPSSRVARVLMSGLSYTVTNTDGTTSTKTTGLRTQPSTGPLLLIPTKDTLPVVAVWSLYDPDTDDCAGTSIVVKMTITLDDNGVPTSSTSSYSAGSGAVSGFAIVGSNVVVAKSAVGEGAKASVSKVPGLTIESGTGTPTPIWWRELQ